MSGDPPEIQKLKDQGHIEDVKVNGTWYRVWVNLNGVGKELRWKRRDFNKREGIGGISTHGDATQETIMAVMAKNEKLHTEAREWLKRAGV